MVNIFLSLAVTGTVGAVFALAIYISKNIIRKHFPSHWLYYMWAAVLVLMVLPLRIEFPSMTENSNIPKNESAPGEVVFIVSEPKHNGTTVFSDNETAYGGNNTDNIGTNSENRFNPAMILGYVSRIWFICAALLFAYKVISYIIFYISVMKNSAEIDIPEMLKYAKRKIRTRVCPSLSSPLMTGVLFPVLFLPATELSGGRLEYVLKHETIHLKRFDILLKWFSMAVSCIHFYNPAVYLACKGLSEECEISCDATVVKHMDKEQKRAYVETILSLLTSGKNASSPLTTGMTGNKSLLRTRFTLIKERKSTSKIILTVSVAVSVIFLFVAVIASGIIGSFVPEAEVISPKATVFDNDTDNGNVNTDMYIGMINASDTSLMDIIDGDGDLVMTIPSAVAEQFPAFVKTPGKTDLIIFCGKIDSFLWAGVTTKGVMSKSHTNICTSSDGGKNWFVSPDGYFGKGIVEKIWFSSEKEGFISYSGGGYGKGISKTSDGGVTWEHFMEHDYALPISHEDALKLLKHQLIFAYENIYGNYMPLYEEPESIVPDSEYLRYAIENLEVTKEDEDYYYIPVIWDFLIEKQTGRIVKFYDGLDKMLIPFDPYSPDALAFAG